MPHITSVDISITTVDSTGTATSAPELYGVVRNIQGTEVQVLTFQELTETSSGVYEISGYDVSDTNLFPGTEFTIFWCTNSDTVSPQIALQRYTIYGTHPSGVTTRLLTWMPSYRKTNLYGYSIYRQLADEPGPTLLGRSLFPYFFDRSVYSPTTDFHTAAFQINELVWDASLSTTEPVDGIGISIYNRIENQKEYCEVFGQIYDVIGGSSADTVNFFVHEEDAPQENSTSFLMRRNEFTAPVNFRGEFSAPLIQGALVTAEISDAGIYRRFVVPSSPAANLKDITCYPLDAHRAQ